MRRRRYLDPRTCDRRTPGDARIGPDRGGRPGLGIGAAVLFAVSLAGCGGEGPDATGAGEPGTAAPVTADRGTVGSTSATAAVSPDATSTATLPPPADPRFQLGRQLLLAGRFEEAEVVFAALDREGPRHPSVAFLHAVAIQKQKSYAPALERLDELATLSVDYPERRSLQHFRGWCLFYLGRPDEAAEAFSAHLAQQPDEPDSHFGLGVSRLELGETEAALASFDRAIELDLGRDDRRRDLAKAWIRRGDALWELGRIEEATASFHKGVIQFPDHYEGWAKLARGHERLGDADKVAWATREERNARARVGAPIDGDLAEPDA